ncbi:MAG: sulfur carrier protein ThiS [Deltaproteobacteria bacterium]|nr:sulfur carrier protein ThiS [Deltaproteobacteria bacterium]
MREKRASSMEIIVNGEKKRFERSLSVADLVKDLGLEPKTVIVELNLQVVSRDEMGRTPVRDGDRLEIVGIFGGG